MFRKITTLTIITLSYLILTTNAWPLPQDAWLPGQDASQIPIIIFYRYIKLITAIVYLLGISVIYLSVYRLGARSATPTIKSITFPVTLILIGILSFIGVVIAGFNKFFDDPIIFFVCLWSMIILIAAGFYILGKRKARTTKPNLTITIIVFIIGVLLCFIPALVNSYRTYPCF